MGDGESGGTQTLLIAVLCAIAVLVVVVIVAIVVFVTQRRRRGASGASSAAPAQYQQAPSARDIYGHVTTTAGSSDGGNAYGVLHSTRGGSSGSDGPDYGSLNLSNASSTQPLPPATETAYVVLPTHVEHFT